MVGKYTTTEQFLSDSHLLSLTDRIPEQDEMQFIQRTFTRKPYQMTFEILLLYKIYHHINTTKVLIIILFIAG